MVKRTPLPNPTKSSPKKRKVDVHQHTLENFFSSPLRGSSSRPKREHSTHEESDAQLALSLAEREGIELDAVRKLEKEWKEMQAYPADVAVVAGNAESDGLTSTDLGLSTAVPMGSRSQGHFGRTEAAQAADITPNARAKQLVFGSQISDPLPYKTLSEDPLIHPGDEPWPAGTATPYSFLAHTLAELSGTRSRILIMNILTSALRTIIRLDQASLLPTLYLLSNTLAPAYETLELGLGPSIISRAIEHVSGISHQALKRLYNKTGDPGDVAFEAKSNLRTLIPHPPLLISFVHSSLVKIAHCKGPGAAKQKQAIVERLLVAAKGEEVRFLVRTLVQNLRVGAVRTSILCALARAMVLTTTSEISATAVMESQYHADSHLLSQARLSTSGSKSKITGQARDEINIRFNRAERLIRKTYVQRPNYDDIVKALLEAGLDNLPDRAPLTVGTPLLPTLGSPARSLDEIYERLAAASWVAEFKYDGQRAQIHAFKDEARTLSVRIFSRHLEEMTSKYPDVVLLVENIFACSSTLRSFIMDSEIVAIDRMDGSLNSFQELSSRARKDVMIGDVKVNVAVFAFDLMYLDGEVLLEKSFRERRALLRSRLPPFAPRRNAEFAQLRHVDSCESEAGKDAIEAFWETAIESRCEGLMIKLLDNADISDEHPGKRKPLPATYEPDKRTSAWLKLKKDYVIGLGDSLDLVPIGAWHGNGRKAQWWSPILLALYDPSMGNFVAVCKCMSGFTDVFYKALRERYTENSETCSRQPLWDCITGGIYPEVFFKPQEVWEIRGADVTLSPVSKAALGMMSDSRGLSLRFPRFIKVKEDKTVDMASTPAFLAEMYRSQQRAGKIRAGADDGGVLDVGEFESGAGEEGSDRDDS